MKELNSSQELIAFILPIAVALAGARTCRWVLGKEIETQFGFGFRFALGLATGMLVFSHSVLLCAIVGFNGARLLAWLALLWGAAEVVLLAMKFPAFWKTINFQPGHLWVVLLIPLFYSWWVLGRLSTLEGTMEFDANAFWVFRAKILYLEQGQNLIHTIQLPNLAYAHMDYPWLIGGIYTLGYGAVGGVDEFVNKVWPFWMMAGLSIGIISLGKFWLRPNPLPIAIATMLFFLPATLDFIRWEGGTIPMVFYASMTAILLFNAIARANRFALAAAMPVIAGCAASKFEGVMYGLIWLCVLVPFVWKYKWFTDKTFWKSAVFGLLCLMPFVIYRLLKPDTYSLDSWWKAYVQDWWPVFTTFLKAFALYFAGRFFSGTFFHWQLVNTSHVQWDGKWGGPGSFVNDQLSVLPWLLLVLLIISFWKKPQRLPLLSLCAVMVAIMAFLTLVLGGVAYIESPTPNTIVYSDELIAWNSTRDIGRYFFPFFTAWFLATITMWFTDKTAPQQIPEPEKKVAASLAPKSKKQR